MVMTSTWPAVILLNRTAYTCSCVEIFYHRSAHVCGSHETLTAHLLVLLPSPTNISPMQRRPPWTTTATRTLTCRCWPPLGGARAPPTRSLVSRNSRGSTQYTLGPGHGRSGSSSVPGLGRRLLLGHSAPPRGPPSGIAVLGQREFSSSPSSCSTFSLRLSYGCLIWVTIFGDLGILASG